MKFRNTIATIEIQAVYKQIQAFSLWDTIAFYPIFATKTPCIQFGIYHFGSLFYYLSLYVAMFFCLGLGGQHEKDVSD